MVGLETPSGRVEMPRRLLARLSAIAGLVVRNIPDEMLGWRIRQFIYRRMLRECSGSFSIASRVEITGIEAVSIGRGTAIGSGARIYAHESNGVAFGRECGIGLDVIVSAADGGSVSLGDHVMIGPRSILIAADHAFADVEVPMRFQGHVAKSIYIDDDVWIGANSVILGGVKIGKGSIIGAGAVVTKDVAPMEVWGGVPARLIKSRLLIGR